MRLCKRVRHGGTLTLLVMREGTSFTVGVEKTWEGEDMLDYSTLLASPNETISPCGTHFFFNIAS